MFHNITVPVYFLYDDMVHDNETDAKIANTLQSGLTFMTDASHFLLDTNEFVVGQTGFYEI